MEHGQGEVPLAIALKWTAVVDRMCWKIHNRSWKAFLKLMKRQILIDALGVNVDWSGHMTVDWAGRLILHV